MSLQHVYVRYLAALPVEQKCACGSHVIGRCPTCSLPKEKEQLSLLTDPQLSLFACDMFTVYHNER